MKILRYTDYRTAGYRNLNVCNELLLRLNDCEPRHKSHILHKIFYLSGYIIEFCFKYSLFSNEKVNHNDNIYEYRDENFRKKWREHDFNKLKKLCADNNVIFSSDIPYFGSKVKNKNIESLLKAWNVQIRYSLSLSNNSLILNEKQVKELINFLKEVLNKITSKYS